MTFFADTSVLVAGCVRQHPFFSRGRTVLEAAALQDHAGFISCHSVAEMYSALTSLPVAPRILPAEAERIIQVNVLKRFRQIPVTEAMYERAMDACVRRSLIGGKIYDALLIECARTVQSDRIYTFNLEDFRRLAPDLDALLVAP